MTQSEDPGEAVLRDMLRQEEACVAAAMRPDASATFVGIAKQPSLATDSGNFLVASTTGHCAQPGRQTRRRRSVKGPPTAAVLPVPVIRQNLSSIAAALVRPGASAASVGSAKRTSSATDSGNMPVANTTDHYAQRGNQTRRRHSVKGPPTAADSAVPMIGQDQSLLAAALIAEAPEELAFLPINARRTHIHWTHVRTKKKEHVQPCQMTRKAFWQHLVKCYKEAYPLADGSTDTGSILGFGLVAAEQHALSSKSEERDSHKHAPTFCVVKHYWNKVAKISLKKYNIPLNAVAHDSYATMYAYVRHPTKKKPLQELDAEPFLSPKHPRGQELQELLAASETSSSMHQNRWGSGGTQGATKRERAPDLFQLVRTKKFRCSTALRAHAADEVAAGRPALAEFCTKQGHKLDTMMQSAWAVIDAPEKLRRESMTLLDKLAEAATSLSCCCHGKWIPGAIHILQNNRINPAVFCAAIRRALKLGALRGVNVACVGAGGCGKSSLIEPLEKIFSVLPKPQGGSTFTFTDRDDLDIILWQDYEHHEDTARFTDILSVFVGETFGVRVPGAKNIKVRNKAPVFFSGRTPIRSQHKNPVARETLNGMMDERFTTFSFTEPLLLHRRVSDWPICGRCAASLYLNGPPPVPCAPLVAVVAPSAPQSGEHVCASSLDALSRLYAAGFLSVDEFTAAKRRVLS